jgi:hypothetical protein
MRPFSRLRACVGPCDSSRSHRASLRLPPSASTILRRTAGAVGGVSPVPAPMWQHGASPAPGADVAWGEPSPRCQCGMGRAQSPVPMWHGASPAPVPMCEE